MIWYIVGVEDKIYDQNNPGLNNIWLKLGIK